jgi:hypothetical protein
MSHIINKGRTAGWTRARAGPLSSLRKCAVILKLALTIAANADNDKDKRNRQPLNHILAADPDAHADERVLEIKNLDKLGPEWEGWTPEAQEHRRKEVEKIKADAAK